MDIEINTFDGIKLKTANTYVEEDINLSVSDKAFEEILYDGEVENGTLGANKFASLVDGSMTEVTAQDLAGAKSIGSYAFYNRSKLTSIEIPNSVTSIGQSAFYRCSNLISVTMTEGVKSLGSSTFFECENLTNINIPSSVTSIGAQAFYRCYKLPSITIPDGVKSLGNGTFRQCTALTSITIPASVESIAQEVFYSCSSLTTIRMLSDIPPTLSSTSAMPGNANLQIIVPKSENQTVLTAYKSASNWSNFASKIVEATE